MRRLALIAALALAAACAQQAFPPGGPPRHIPPKLLTVAPESGSVNMHEKVVNLTYDEVVSERPASGGQSLSDLVLISPRDGNPKVGWHRMRLDIRGQRPWKPNTAYTVTLRAGLADLHNNVVKRPVVIIFSTGPAIPHTVISGVVFDWPTGKPVANALVQAFLPPDSTHYITLADSSGRFSLLTLPSGPVTVRGVADANNNRALDPREAWDTATVQLRDTVQLELYAFVHDSVGPHLAGLTVHDSLTLRATFDKPVDLAQRLDTLNFTVRAADSSIVPLRAVATWRDFDKARQDSTARADSISGKKDSTAGRRRAAAPTAARDSVPKVPPPTPTRALPHTEFVVIVARPLAPGSWYRLESRGVRNLLGDTATSVRSVQVPKPPPPKPAKDTTAAHALPPKPPARDSGAAAPPPPPPLPPRPPQR